MNKLTIIGNLTRDPELRTTSAGINVCDFTVAVNRRARRDAQAGQPEADFFRVSAWRQLGENCSKFLTKGRKVCVVGPVSVRTYQANDGTTRANLEVTAEDVELHIFPRRPDLGLIAVDHGIGSGLTYSDINHFSLPPTFDFSDMI